MKKRKSNVPSADTALHLDWCSHEAAKYAVTYWHYSRRMPAGKLVKIGVWESGLFVGCALFGRGATPQVYKSMDCQQTDLCELVRIALRTHSTPVSRIVRIALRMLRRQSPKLQGVVSFADTGEGHHGGIYQAGNWMYLGLRKSHYLVVNGEQKHTRSLGGKYGVGGQSISWLRQHVDQNATKVESPKHKYFYPFTSEIRRKFEHLVEPYPKRAGSIASDAVANQAAEGGATPTPALCKT